VIPSFLPLSKRGPGGFKTAEIPLPTPGPSQEGGKGEADFTSLTFRGTRDMEGDDN